MCLFFSVILEGRSEQQHELQQGKRQKSRQRQAMESATVLDSRTLDPGRPSEELFEMYLRTVHLREERGKHLSIPAFIG